LEQFVQLVLSLSNCNLRFSERIERDFHLDVWLGFEGVYEARNVEVELILLDLCETRDVSVLQQLIRVLVEGREFRADGVHIPPVVLREATGPGDALIALSQFRDGFLTLLVQPSALSLRGLLLCLGLRRVVVGLCDTDLLFQLSELVDNWLVLGHETAHFFLFTSVDLLADPTTVMRDQAWHFRGVAVGVVVNEDAHHILRAKFVLRREVPVMPRGIDEQHLVLALCGPPLVQD
jgi:hypothetical protein